jgi:hypothetical protein
MRELCGVDCDGCTAGLTTGLSGAGADSTGEEVVGGGGGCSGGVVTGATGVAASGTVGGGGAVEVTAPSSTAGGGGGSIGTDISKADGGCGGAGVAGAATTGIGCGGGGGVGGSSIDPDPPGTGCCGGAVSVSITGSTERNLLSISSIVSAGFSAGNWASSRIGRNAALPISSGLRNKGVGRTACAVGLNVGVDNICAGAPPNWGTTALLRAAISPSVAGIGENVVPYSPGSPPLTILSGSLCIPCAIIHYPLRLRY